MYADLTLNALSLFVTLQYIYLSQIYVNSDFIFEFRVKISIKMNGDKYRLLSLLLQ